MDVHPPLAKLLITLAGWLAGFDGSFDFKEIGMDYLEAKVPYVAMRMLPAVCGIMTIPLMFLTAKAMGTSTASAALAAGLVIFGIAPIHCQRIIHTNNDHRQCSCHSIPSYPSRFPSRRLHGFHCVGVDVLFESSRAGPSESFQPQLVVLAGNDWTWPRRHCQCQMGWIIYHCMGGCLNPVAALDTAWRYEERDSGRHPDSSHISID